MPLDRIGLAGTVLALALIANGPVRAAPSDFTASALLRDSVAQQGLMRHVEALQAIADRSGGNRAAGTEGYDRSADYVARTLRAAGYAVTEQEFTFPHFAETAPPVLARVGEGDALSHVARTRTMRNSGSGTVEAPLVPVALGLDGSSPSTSASGCAPSDFAGFETGSIALLRRGTCSFTTKVENAAAAGAAGVVVMNAGTGDATGPFGGQLAKPAAIPAVAIPFDAGAALADAGPIRVRLSVSAEARTIATRNVIADLPGTDGGRVVLAGAHLDGVPEGPGINDNASGTAAVLEAAVRLAQLDAPPRRTVRFAFWGAEELGLLGSRHYVDTLPAEELARIEAVLNFDMLGSVNGVPLVYDGDGSSEGPAAPDGSAGIERMFRDYFAAAGEEVKEISYGGSSDHASFAARGIPVGGLYTGSMEVKSAESAERWGGTAGQPLDPCYHEACDDTGNVDAALLDRMADAAAHGVLTLARRAMPAG
ncbi:M20/M25/M40 family metallo-hydrolase [Arenibaculum sp.]|uniref:M20/M25/M40 family metallo-hydrolase n=1 Tax=Arenibaculum sp. TaxID=2865862 RepID=UPI002E0DCC5F|nr:M20/M25/M40 family metallo-hydrolase [Arenibaculum sp.]